jgi:hypothetical protein
LKKFKYKGGEKYMTTVVNNPPPSNDSSGGIGTIIGLIVLIVAVYLFFVYGLPAIQNVQLGTPQIKINMPSKIDVNVQPAK